MAMRPDDAPRTPFASGDLASPVVAFPGEAMAWVRPASAEVALVDAHGRVERFASEGELHAEVLRRNAWVTMRAQAIVLQEKADAQAAAFDAPHWLARLPYIIAGVTGAQLRAAALIGFIPTSVWGAAEIVTRSLRVLAELAP